jgi:hypothetical protein
VANAKHPTIAGLLPHRALHLARQRLKAEPAIGARQRAGQRLAQPRLRGGRQEQLDGFLEAALEAEPAGSSRNRASRGEAPAPLQQGSIQRARLKQSARLLMDAHVRAASELTERARREREVIEACRLREAFQRARLALA